MEHKGTSIKLSTFLKYGLTKVKSYLVDVWLGSKYASVSITLLLEFLKRTVYKKLMNLFQVLAKKK